MSWRCLVAFSFVALSLISCSTSKSVKEIGKLAGESVVFINYEDQPGHGTGFFVVGEDNQACTVLTVRHVIPSSAKFQLQTPDKKIWKGANITSIKRFSKQDLAVVTFNPDSGSCPYKALNFGNSDNVSLGDTIYITGFPGSGLAKQFTVGTVSLIDSQTQGYGISYTAITAAGMSGSPVMNTSGQVVAVHGRTDVELSREAELKGEQPPPQQQSTTVTNPSLGDAVGTFKWGIPINTYVANFAQVATEADNFLNEGNDLSVSQRYEKAIVAYEKALEIRPDLHEAWFGKGFAQGELKRYSDAIASYDKAIALKPDKHEAWNNRGTALDELQRYNDAIASYDKAIALKPDYANAWYNRGYALNRLQRYDDAIASYDKAIALKPDDANAWYNRGYALNGLQRYSDEIASYDKAIAIKPDKHEAWNNRGTALDELQRYDEALKSYDKAIAIKPDKHEAWNNRGTALDELQRYDEALKSYDKAISIKPDYQQAINNRKQLLTKLGRSTLSFPYTPSPTP
ncbi:hypothetical protein WA1_04055 [Scytonema hofmannii PCC 7110]|uniref:Uncharacterized protein n=1 Tax=Scytonema hofmannii PCC 7110 TaxID=128403 RepID=A0A139WZ25_9CYAN|nr:tetratricopeptide repeat-containing serine protease family protein [Scytonema hofmannii]KYC37701.1 hypothetical protein WA1_04055 [Scytonema hofmannii PCC 7110]